MNKDLYIGTNILKKTKKSAEGEIVFADNEKFYKITGYDCMPPFLMNIVSDSDLWMFISSNGALTAGRKDPDNALFPYYTDDRIHDSSEITGNKTIIIVSREDKLFLWEPFSTHYEGLYNVRRNLYKSIFGNKIIFEEFNEDLHVSYQYAWMNCDKFGFVKKSKISNTGSGSVIINILDGIQNILPFGASRQFQLEFSTLLDGYKKNELVEEAGLGLYTLSSIPTDKAEPSEALKATTVWSTGLENSLILLSSNQINSFKEGTALTGETSINGTRGSYLLQNEFELKPEKSREWYVVADVNKDHSDVVSLSAMLRFNRNINEQLEDETIKSTENLKVKIAGADGFQISNDRLITSRHISNVLFNIMRGGIFDKGYCIKKSDFQNFISETNKALHEKYSSFFDELNPEIDYYELICKIKDIHDGCLEKLCLEYLPLTFSRRHGDPSRPWNHFSINIKDEDGNKILNYEGNWRDIFQNWEALAYSFPGYLENMIVKFLNASTADGYNPYKLNRIGFDWEVPDPSNPWANIGYWGDHQIVYLFRLLKLSSEFHPGTLKELLSNEIFAYADVPYKQKTYEDIIKDPHNTIEFDSDKNEKIIKRVKEIGTDGKFVSNSEGKIYLVNLTEKLLVGILVKISNFIPGAGIWMNTQRPEWNDANNALVGYGTSMVTLYYLRRFISFCVNLFGSAGDKKINISEELYKLFESLLQTLKGKKELLKKKISDCERKIILDGFAVPGSEYRSTIYKNGFSGRKVFIAINEIVEFLQLALDFIDHSIKANRRDDDLYHSYNLIKFNINGEIIIRNLYEMLEGQAAILSSGYLSVEDSLALLGSLRKSRLFREDQSSFILYPDRKLAKFTEKNYIPEELLDKSELLQNLIKQNNKSIVYKDINGRVHFNGKFRNAAELKQSLSVPVNSYKPSSSEIASILDIYEAVFDHQSFTGRSGTFYKYEGLGCIYWHMVSKLLLAVEETYLKASEDDEDVYTLNKLKKYYYLIREGIGSHKSPELYGAIPTDPYSHTPSNMGAQQPGMTGQVKEDIISRFGELGLKIKNGTITFNPVLLSKKEFLDKSQVYRYYDVNGNPQSLMLNKGMLAFTFCQVPVIYINSNEDRIVLTKKDGSEEVISGLSICDSLSRSIFKRENEIIKINVLIKSQLIQ